LGQQLVPVGAPNLRLSPQAAMLLLH